VKTPNDYQECPQMADGIDLSDYLHRSQAEARENELLDAINAMEGDETKYKGRIRELESKLRGQTYRAAFDKIATKAGVSAEHRDDVFDLVKFVQDVDVPDPKAMAKHLKAWLEARPARQRYLDDVDPDADDDEPTGKARLHTELDDEDEEEDEPPAPKPKARGGRPAAADGKFRYTSDNLSDPDWMQQHGNAYAAAQVGGTAVKVG
jgi:hypothetical protein